MRTHMGAHLGSLGREEVIFLLLPRATSVSRVCYSFFNIGYLSETRAPHIQVRDAFASVICLHVIVVEEIDSNSIALRCLRSFGHGREWPTRLPGRKHI